MGCSTRGEMIMADISVPYWNIVDVNMLCEGARLIGFDLDNTLARSKKPMKADMAECFSALTSLIDVAVITGGKYSLLQSQVVDRLSDHADKSKLHLMPTSGTRYYRWDGQRWGKVFSHDLSDEDRAKAKESLERNAREQGIWATHVWGERIEDRGGQITFSALGQLAPVEAKEAWDPTNEKKNRLACAVAAELPNLEVRPGGSSSVDISQRGVDKSFAVRELADILDIEVGQIVNTHGVRGEVKVQPWDVSPELLCGFKTFYMDGAPFRPTSKRVQGDMVLMKLPEVDDMDTAAALKRKVLSIRRNDVQLKPGEHFDAEIIGMNVYNYFPHTYIGTVVDVLSYPAHKLYKVKGEEKTYLIPAVKDIFITDIDEEAREISVHMIEGLETDED